MPRASCCILSINPSGEWSKYAHVHVSPRLHLHPLTQQCKYEFTLEANDHMIIKISPRFHLHPLTQQCNYDFTLEPNYHKIIKISPRFHLLLIRNPPRFHLHPLPQQSKDDFTLEPTDHMIIKNLPSFSPASVDSTMQIRLYLRTKRQHASPLDFTCIRWLHNANTTLP